ncbi:hypothetical protein [Luedemannella flava]|uniref:hypothetical protein n=1 Tax=Luedemannella flava TaxID=349316 RepID=UPI0031D75382
MTPAGMPLPLRAAVVGLVAAASGYAACRFVSALVLAEADRKPDLSGVGVLGVLILYGVGAGVVAAVVSAWLAAWLLRLPHPWLFALVASVPGLLVACQTGWLVVVVTPLVYAAVVTRHPGEEDMSSAG